MKKLQTFLFWVLLVSTGLSQPGSLDPSFGVDGKVTTSFTVNDDHAYAVHEMQDGKLLVAGFAKPGIHSDFLLTRYYPDGSLDNTFASAGSVIFDFNGSDDVCYSIGVQNDGKILMAGRTFNGMDNDFAIARLNSNGTLDNSFGTVGKVTTPVGTDNDYGRAMAIQSDGKIIVAGYSRIGTNEDFAVLRYLSDGSLDNSFGTGGKKLIGIGTSHDLCFDIQLQSDGKILLSGHSVVGAQYDFALVRLLADGTPDSTFGTGGAVTAHINGGNSWDIGYELAILGDGSILLGGYTWNGTDYDFGLARFTDAGVLDNGFGSGGTVSTSVGTGDDIARFLVVQSDGKILLGGYANNGSNDDFAIVRYNADGSLDNTFGSLGVVTTMINNSDDRAFACVVQNTNQSILVVGYSNTGSADDYSLVRYLTGLETGVRQFTDPTISVVVYPNPINEQFTLSFKLLNDETLNFYLVDGAGRKMGHLLSEMSFSTGSHNLRVDLPGPYSPGFYTLVMDNGSMTEAVPVWIWK